jgi:hypothetical protein
LASTVFSVEPEDSEDAEAVTATMGGAAAGRRVSVAVSPVPSALATAVARALDLAKVSNLGFACGARPLRRVGAHAAARALEIS